MRRAVLALVLTAALGVVGGCADEPVTPPAPAAATSSAPTTQDSPGARFLTRINRQLTSTLTDQQMLQVGQTVCALAASRTREEMVELISTESTRGNVEAAAIITATAHSAMCPTVQFASAPAEPEGPLTSFGPGTWEVGVDVAAGKYKTTGGAQCYWARLQANDGSFGDIIDNGLGAGPQTVTIRDGEYFETQRCADWELQP